MFESLNFVWRRNWWKTEHRNVHGQNITRIHGRECYVPMLFIKKIMYDFNRNNWTIHQFNFCSFADCSKFFVFLHDFLGILLHEDFTQVFHSLDLLHILLCAQDLNCVNETLGYLMCHTKFDEKSIFVSKNSFETKTSSFGRICVKTTRSYGDTFLWVMTTQDYFIDHPFWQIQSVFPYWAHHFYRFDIFLSYSENITFYYDRFFG